MSWHNELSGFTEKSTEEKLAEQVALNARLREALTKISDPEGADDICECTHDDEDCCNAVGHHCPHCIADAALSLSGPTALAGLKAQVLRDYKSDLSKWYGSAVDVKFSLSNVLHALEERAAALEAEGKGANEQSRKAEKEIPEAGKDPNRQSSVQDS